MPLRFEILTAERRVYSDEVDMVVAPGQLGELGILPNHAPLLTPLQPGELRIKKGSDEVVIAVSGGFLEMFQDQLTILADAAERAEEIDVERHSGPWLGLRSRSSPQHPTQIWPWPLPRLGAHSYG